MCKRTFFLKLILSPAALQPPKIRVEKAWFKMGANNDIEISTGTSQDKETKGTTCDRDKLSERP